jgi:hypothetical protein
MREFFKRLFCRHKNKEITGWHWHYRNIGLAFAVNHWKCKDCGHQWERM